MEFHHYVRGDVKFAGLDELKAQLAQDKVDVLNCLNRDLSN
jgi:riboflavin kinase/FMN adenylyltransferase